MGPQAAGNQGPDPDWLTYKRRIDPLGHDRIEAPWLLDQPMNADRFLVYVRNVLAPTLQPGDMVVWTTGKDTSAPTFVRPYAKPEPWGQFLFTRPVQRSTKDFKITLRWNGLSKNANDP